MSHTTTIKSVAIRDAAAIQRAVADLQAKGVNCRLEADAKPRMYYTRQEEQCDYVLRLDGAVYGGRTFDVGFIKNADGTYRVIMDEWGSAISGQIGAACPLPGTPEGNAQHVIGQFLQEYSKNAAINAASAQGYMVSNTYLDNDGNYQIEIAV